MHTNEHLPLPWCGIVKLGSIYWKYTHIFYVEGEKFGIEIANRQCEMSGFFFSTTLS